MAVASFSRCQHIPPAIRHLLCCSLPHGVLRGNKASHYRLFSNTPWNCDMNDGFTGTYDPTVEPGRGPMFAKSRFGVPQFYPRDLKRRIDDYVVGQDRAKKTICSTIFNHYQNMRRRHQREHDERNVREKAMRQQYAREREMHQKRRDAYNSKNDVLSDTDSRDFTASSSAHMAGTNLNIPKSDEIYDRPYETPEHFYIQDEDIASTQYVTVDKSNLLLVGPTGVGKTYILETLSKKLQVPFAICDCNSLTQAGYIGQDVESCVERLLIDAGYDVGAAEHGIIVLDEFDKLARRETATGRDVSGEGVQQALLKLVEGTKVVVNVKENRSHKTTSINASHSGSGSSPLSTQHHAGGKPEQFVVDTTNILFVFSGAFVGLDKTILQRVAKPSMGFGSELKKRTTATDHSLPKEQFKHLPHYNEEVRFTPLDLVEPSDLQKFGFIPELIGRLHNICTLNPLSENDLYRILTEPRNSLVAQYKALFDSYPSSLHFTDQAIQAIAKRASETGTGARGLRMEMERILAEPMFDAPVAYVVITKACVEGIEKARYWGKSGKFEVERCLQNEVIHDADSQSSFEDYRQAGQSGG